MKRLLRYSLVITTALALTGVASARGFHLRLFAPLVTQVTDRLPTEGVGDSLFGVQEGLHETVTRLTGVSVPHDYVWLHIGKLSVPIDPINFSR